MSAGTKQGKVATIMLTAMVGYSALSQRVAALAEKIVPAREFRASPK